MGLILLVRLQIILDSNSGRGWRRKVERFRHFMLVVVEHSTKLTKVINAVRVVTDLKPVAHELILSKSSRVANTHAAIESSFSFS